MDFIAYTIWYIIYVCVTSVCTIQCRHRDIEWFRSIALNNFLAYPHVPGLTTATNLFYIEKAYEERGEEKMNQRNQSGKVELLQQSHFFRIPSSHTHLSPY